MRVTKGCGKMLSNETYFAEIWFSGVKTTDEAISEGGGYCEPVQMINKGNFLGMLEKVDEVVAMRVLSCYEDYYNNSL